MPKATEAIQSMQNMSEAHYTEIWTKLFATMLYGFWGRFFFVALLLMALFFGVRRRNPKAAIFLIAVAVLIAFGGWFMKVTNIM